MTAAGALAFPGSRKLAGWWRQVAPLHPESLWVGHLLFHKVEALVATTEAHGLDGLTLLVLRAIALIGSSTAAPPGGEDALEALEDRLQLGVPLLRQMLRELEAEGLVTVDSDGRWQLTGSGQQALEREYYERPRHERRTFYFLDGRGPRGVKNPPRFVNVRHATTLPWPAGESITFDPRALQACIDQSPDWKIEHGFPEDVTALVGDLAQHSGSGRPRAAQSTHAELLRRVIVDHPVRLAVLLALTSRAAHPDCLYGLAISEDGWTLRTTEPHFALGPDWQEAFPALHEGTADVTWRKAWRAWCEQRDLPADEAEACTLQQEGISLLVSAPASLVRRLRETRSEALRDEAWLLGGEERIRPAARIKLIEGTPENPVNSADLNI